MSPYVAGLSVDSEYGAKTWPKGFQFGSMALYQKAIVLQPFWQRVTMYDLPSRVPHTPDEVFTLFYRLTGHLSDGQVVAEHVVIFGGHVVLIVSVAYHPSLLMMVYTPHPRRLPTCSLLQSVVW